jgi:hypothetical protein
MVNKCEKEIKLLMRGKKQPDPYKTGCLIVSEICISCIHSNCLGGKQYENKHYQDSCYW